MVRSICLLLELIWFLFCESTTLQLKTLNLTYPSYSYGGASAFYNDKLYSWNGYECNTSSTMSMCSPFSTDNQYTLNISGLQLDLNRNIIISSISSKWTQNIVTDPMHSSYSFPVLIQGVDTETFTYSHNYAWILFPSYGSDYRTRIALKYNLSDNKYVNFTDYNEFIPTGGSIWTAACNTNDGTYVYAIGGRGSSNSVQSNKAFRYHIFDDIWEQLNNLDDAFFNPSCAVINEIPYSLGGQSGPGMSTRRSKIIAYTGSTWTKVGDLRTARQNAISFTHPNNWIITVGGLDKTDNWAETIEVFDPLTSVSTNTNMLYGRKRYYHAQYQYDSNTKILFLFGGWNSITQKAFNDIQYIVLSINDATLPTSAPTFSPTDSPSQTPSNHPTYAPSIFPTAVPFELPSTAPSSLPTNVPSIYPSINPTFTPTIPTNNPSNIPSNVPSNIPTETPYESSTSPITNEPSSVPTIAPKGMVTDTVTTTSLLTTVTEDNSDIAEGFFSTEVITTIILGIIVSFIIILGIIVTFIIIKKKQQQNRRRTTTLTPRGHRGSARLSTKLSTHDSATFNVKNIEMIEGDGHNNCDNIEENDSEGLYDAQVTKGNDLGDMESDSDNLYDHDAQVTKGTKTKVPVGLNRMVSGVSSVHDKNIEELYDNEFQQDIRIQTTKGNITTQTPL